MTNDRNIPLVDLRRQYLSIKPEIDAAIFEVINSSAFIGGKYTQAFERAFAEFCNARHCVGVGNGTDAIFLALKALGIGHGDEVITAANTFIATAEAITMCGAKVVFADADPTSHAIDPEQIEAKITPRTKAIIPVHLYGHPADMDRILQLAAEHDLKVIEDAAQAHGARYKDHVVGSIGHMGCFSFYPGKNLGAYGDAGAIVTNDEELATKARMLANHGRVQKYNHEIEGVNSRLDGLQASILATKLKHLPDWTNRRREIANQYNHCLKDTHLVTPCESEDVEAAYHLYVVRTKRSLRDSLIKHLKSKGISSGIHYPIPLPALDAYAYMKHSEEDFPVATELSTRILSLPMFPELEDREVRYIVQQIEDFETHHV